MTTRLEFKPFATIPKGRFVRYAPYVPGMRYSLGFDTSLGIPEKDLDAAVLLDCDRKQVATLEGRWGMGFTPLLKKLIDGYGGKTNVFIVGEAATLGVPILRELWDCGYTWMYYHRQVQKAGREQTDMLGHVPRHDDITITWLQQAIARAQIDVRDEVLHTQLTRYSFLLRNKAMDEDEATRSSQYVMGAPSGEHDDLVRALALANAGIEWLPQFKAPAVEMSPDSFAAVLGHAKVLNPPKAKNYWS